MRSGQSLDKPMAALILRHRFIRTQEEKVNHCNTGSPFLIEVKRSILGDKRPVGSKSEVKFSLQFYFLAPISFRWCVLSAAEKNKCTDFMMYVRETTRNKSLNVDIGCVEENSVDDCVAKIKSDEADLMTLNGADMYKAGTG